MDIQTLTTFFMWCTIIDVALFAAATAVLMAAPDFVYGLQSRWFPVTRETYDVVIYAYLGFLKLLILVFNVVPYIALLILG